MRGEPVHSTQMFFCNASGETTRVNMSTLVVRGRAGDEIVHLLECLSAREKEQASVAPPSSKYNSNARLSARQLEVLKHLGSGKGTKEIAETLCISPSTVRHHVQDVLTRLKVHNRLEAVTLARRIGLI